MVVVVLYSRSSVETVDDIIVIMLDYYNCNGCENSSNNNSGNSIFNIISC